MIKGSCLCGSVAYQADGPISPIVHCHCETCRKTHGSAFSSVATVPKAGFKWTQGEATLSSYESSQGKTRYFCSNCGSHIVAEREDADIMLLRMGCVEGDPGTRPAAHIWRSDAACWYDPTEELPELPNGIPSK
ncbi:MAG: GFA family protein [Hyphomonadaceae bacterium]